MKENKVVIIGSGIAGMTAAIYLKRVGLEPIIIENNAPGGMLNIIPNIENYPGYISIAGPDLAMNIYNQVNELGIKYLYKNIKNISLKEKTIDNEIKFDYLIIATGRSPRLLNLENEKEYLGKGISTCALCDGTFYKDKEVIVVGGGSSALTEAIYLSSICKKVTIVHRRNTFTAEQNLISKINKIKNIKIMYNANIKKYNIKKDKIVSVSLDNNKKINCSGVFLSIGSIPNTKIFDIDKEDNYIVVNNNYQTNIDYVYAIGDVIKKDVYQLTTAVGDATIAANSIIKKEANNK